MFVDKEYSIPLQDISAILLKQLISYLSKYRLEAFPMLESIAFTIDDLSVIIRTFLNDRVYPI